MSGVVDGQYVVSVKQVLSASDDGMSAVIAGEVFTRSGRFVLYPVHHRVPFGDVRVDDQLLMTCVGYAWHWSTLRKA